MAKVIFVGIGSEQLGISQLSSMLKNQGHTVNLVFTHSFFHDRYNLEIPWLSHFFDESNDIVKDILDQEPDIIAFSCITSTFQWAINIARKVRGQNPSIKTIFGGVHISAVSDICMQYSEIDYAVIGEGDIAIGEIVNNIENGVKGNPIDNTIFKNLDGTIVKGRQVGFYQDLDTLPFPDKTIWEPYINIKDNYLIMASRGCPYTCSFCFNNFFAKLPEGNRGKYVRQRSVAHVIQELKWAKERYHIKSVNFQDDVFTVNKNWIREFCIEYKKHINVPFNCLVHPKYIDEEIVRWMSEAKCEWIQMGIQTMDENFKYQNLRRYEESEHIVNALRLLKKYKIKVKVDQMLALPGESMTSQETALKLYKEITPDRIQTFWTCFLPGTDMFKKAIVDGLISEEQVYNINHGNDFFFFRNQDNISDEKLVNTYMNYEFLYRILPITPNFLKKYLNISFANIFSKNLKIIIGRAFDLISAIRHINVDFVSYAKLYLKGIFRFYLKKLGYKNYQISKVYNSNLLLNESKMDHNVTSKESA